MGEQGSFNKASAKRKTKALEMDFDSGDDEPIGYMFKLKGKKYKTRVELDGGRDKVAGVEDVMQKQAVENEDLVGMDDTLASFWKKLKGPRKDGGLVPCGGGKSGSGMKLPVQSLNAFRKDEDLLAELPSKTVERHQKGADALCDETVNKGFEKGCKRKSKRSRVSFVPERVDSDDFSEVQRSMNKDVGKASSADGILEDSLSAFLRKSDLSKKSRSSSCLKLGKVTETSGDGSNLSSSSISEDILSISRRTSKKLVEEVPGCGGDASVDPCSKHDCPPPHVAPFQCDTLDDVPSKAILKNPVLATIPKASELGLQTCTNKVSSVQCDEVDYLTTGHQGDITLETHNLTEHCSVSCQESASEDSLKDLPTSKVGQSVASEKKETLEVCDYASQGNSDVNSDNLPNVHTLNTDDKVHSPVLKIDLQSCSNNESLNGQAENTLQGSSRIVMRETLLPSKRILAGSSAIKGNMDMALQTDVRLESENSQKDIGQDQVHSLKSIDSLYEQVTASGCRDSIQIPTDYVDEPLQASLSSGKKDASASGEVQHGDGNDSYSYSKEVACNNYVSAAENCNSISHHLQLFDEMDRGAFSQSCDYLSGDEAYNGSSSPSNVPGPEEVETGSMPDESKDDRVLGRQRAARNLKKCRHGDMAYEGDFDWEVLVQGQDFLISYQDGDSGQTKQRGKLDPSSLTILDAENGGDAAVSAGLKARAVGPIEKIKFKEVLKRKGGLQEYLQCRNRILSLWKKDLSRILPLSECEMPDTPLVHGSPNASLVRDVYTFLDQCGYINFGIASKKDISESGHEHNLKILKEEKFTEKSGASVAESDDGVCFIMGQSKSSEIVAMPNDILSNNEKCAAKYHKDRLLVDTPASELLTSTEHAYCPPDGHQGDGCCDTLANSDNIMAETSGKDENEKLQHVLNPNSLSPNDAKAGGITFVQPEVSKDPFTFQPYTRDYHNQTHSDSEAKKIIIVGAGPAGLTAASHLQRQGYHVTLLEARSRIGGRVFTDRSSLSVPVDLGASIITGIEADVATERRPDPSSLICAQLGLELTVLNSDCPLYDIVTGEKVPANLDEALEAEYNSLLDDMLLLVAQKGEHASKMSLEDGLEYALKRRRMALSERNYVGNKQKSLNTVMDSEMLSASDEVCDNHCLKADILSPLERRVMNWHFANLEYGCAALLKEVSLPHWNQDDVYGGFGGAHCMIKGGYSAVVESLGEGLRIHFNHAVTDIMYNTESSITSDGLTNKVKVSTSNGKEFSGDAVLITVPLGCLKAGAINFTPPLPHWKSLSIQRLGFGVLNKVVLEFPEVFWDDSVDYFGATAEETDRRGQCFMFWNVRKTVDAPVLIALVVGKAAIDGQHIGSSDHVNHALSVLRKLFGDSRVPNPVASVVTDWGRDPYSYGAYSYVAVGSSGEDYDILGRPVGNCLFFAGEATCKEHPDTVGGAMMSGLREAVRIINIFNTGTDFTAEVEATEDANRHLDVEESEVRDIIKRLEAVELSNVCKKSLDGTQILTRDLLWDMFCNAKTTPGRLHLLKALLNLPVKVLKSFAGTKEGLSTLNSWILDSMGKDGTQLLRHCVRLLVLVSTDLVAVRLSGIGKTVKEKVCVHTSRDIRAIASQLVSVWIEIFRKEKASNALKQLRQSTVAIPPKSKYSIASGKPPLRTTAVAPENKRSLRVPTSAGSQLPMNANNKKMNIKPAKSETATDSKSDVKPPISQGSVGRQNATIDGSQNFPLTEEEKNAIAAAEAARAAARAAAEAYASSGAKYNTTLLLPKIPSFHKFARREQYSLVDESDIRRNWSGGAIGKQDCLSEIDSRNCRVQNWSVDFSAAGVNLDGSRIPVDNRSQHSHSNENACQFNFREHSGESAPVDSSILTRAWVDSSDSLGKDYNAIEMWQCQAAAANSDFYDRVMHVMDEEDSNMSSKLPSRRHDMPANESSASQVTVTKATHNQPRGAEKIKQAIVDYVASLLMPLYKARKIDREGYKSIMKKTATKVMEQATDAEKAMAVHEFLDFKRKNKIRAFVDMLIERNMAMNPGAKSRPRSFGAHASS